MKDSGRVMRVVPPSEDNSIARPDQGRLSFSTTTVARCTMREATAVSASASADMGMVVILVVIVGLRLHKTNEENKMFDKEMQIDRMLNEGW